MCWDHECEGKRFKQIIQTVRNQELSTCHRFRLTQETARKRKSQSWEWSTRNDGEKLRNYKREGKGDAIVEKWERQFIRGTKIDK